MKIVDFSIRRPVTIVMLMTALALFGWLSFNRLPVNLLPDISYPTITIRTKYQGSAPIEVENHITKPVEEAVGAIPDVARISSVSRPGVSDVILEFDWKTEMDFASLDIREKLDTVNLPDNADQPILLRFNPSHDPILRIGLYGDESLVKLRLIAEEEIKPLLESSSAGGIDATDDASGRVAAIKVNGGLEEEIQVEVSSAKLARLGLPISRVVQRLVEENVNLTGGSVKEGEVEYLVRTLTEFKQVEEIERIVLLSESDRIVTFGDVASIKKGHKKRTVITRLNGKESVEIAVFKESDANTTRTAKAVKRKISALQKKFAAGSTGLKLEIVYDQSKFIDQSVNDVLSTAMWGGLLAIAALYLFLRNIKSATIIGLTIPLAVMSCFFLMYLSDITLNIMSLGGLALGIGMLVDNSIVALESIDRHRLGGYNRLEAAGLGAGSVGKAMTASTLTTICVFAPMIFVKGIAGQLFADQSLTVAYSLIMSLVVAVTLIPMLSSFTLKFRFLNRKLPAGGKDNKVDNSGRELRRDIDLEINVDKTGTVFTAFQDKYAGVLNFALKRRLPILIGVIACFGGACALFFSLGREFMPELSQGEFVISLKKTEGAPLQSTLDTAKKIEDLVSREPEIKTAYTIVGTTGQTGGSAMEERENVAEINVVLNENTARDDEDRIISRLRTEIMSIPEVEHKFSRPALFSFTTPIEIEISGYNLKKLKRVSDLAINRLKEYTVFSDLKSSANQGNPEIQISFNRQKIAQMGLDINSIATTIRSYVLGTVETEFRRRDRNIDIRVMGNRDDLRSIDDLKNLIINPQSEIPAPLASIADIKTENGPGEIRRINHERAAIISANLSGADLQTALGIINEVFAQIELPRDFEVNVSGQSREMKQAFSSMKFAMLLAVFLVYIVMASQFESLLNPLIIMGSIPFALAGSVAALFITGNVISVVVLIGAVMLTGIVVNNAIVLVDCVNQQRQKGADIRTAIIEAGRIRLRPILMTSATTILALIPMSIGFGKAAELRAGIGITVIGGLFTSTILTLIIVPILYDLTENMKEKLVGSGPILNSET